MSYHVLARKWRPQTFADLVGQSHVVKALTYALSNQQIHHAYLLTGTRGVGKTSIARIFAKSLNCEKNGISASPCDTCESCSEIKAGKFVDLIEVDAASRTGVDETRELIDSVAYLPTKGRYKVYLIDEVHMFSRSSFNALLKTLEEPPAHVKFILATTDPEKLPITILSRCLQFNLKSLTTKQIRQHLVNICQAESVPYDKDALNLLAGAGDGSMRDTLSMTDQAIAYGHGELRLAAVTEILGTIQPNDIEAILFAVATNNPNQLSQTLRRLDDYEVDARAFIIEIMHRLQQMAWAKEGIVEDLSPTLQSTINDIPKPLLHLWYDIAEKSLANLSVAGEPRQAVEMALLRMLAFIPEDWITRHRTPLEALEVQRDTRDTSITAKTNRAADEAVADSSESSANFATQVQASPVTEHDSLDAAEAEFSGNHQSTGSSTQSSSAEDNHSWHLSREDNHSDPTPSMDDVRAIMQSARDLPLPTEHTDQGTTEHSTAVPEAVLERVPPWQDEPIEPSSALSPTPPRVIDMSDTMETVDTPQSVQPAQSTGTTDTADTINVDAFDWYQALSGLGLGDYTHHLASLSILRLEREDGYLQATLDLAPKHELLITEESLQELNQALENHFNIPINLKTHLTELNEQTPQERDKLSQDKQQSDLMTRFNQEPITRQILAAFDGQVIEKTVKAKNSAQSS